MQGLADAFSRLGRMADTDDGAGVLLGERAEGIEQGAASDWRGACRCRQKSSGWGRAPRGAA